MFLNFLNNGNKTDNEVDRDLNQILLQVASLNAWSNSRYAATSVGDADQNHKKLKNKIQTTNKFKSH
jgi:hypothetical protein